MSLSYPIALAVALAAAAPEPPVPLQDSQDIVVSAPRHGKRGPSNEPIETVTHSIRVSTAGLDLSTPAGLQALEPLVRKAAQTACRWLDAHYPVADDEGDCEKNAVADAMTQARAIGATR